MIKINGQNETEIKSYLQLIFRFLYKIKGGINLIYSIAIEKNHFIFRELHHTHYTFFFLILLKVALLLSKKLKSVNFLARISSSDLKNVCLHRRDIFFSFSFCISLPPSGRICLNYDVKSAHHIFTNPFRNLMILE